MTTLKPTRPFPGAKHVFVRNNVADCITAEFSSLKDLFSYWHATLYDFKSTFFEHYNADVDMTFTANYTVLDDHLEPVNITDFEAAMDTFYSARRKGINTRYRLFNPGSKRSNRSCHRHFSTISESRAQEAMAQELKENHIETRSRRRLKLANPWDDYPLYTTRSWKSHRKTQWK